MKTRYRFKKEKYKELLGGKTVKWLSEKLDYAQARLYLIFNCHIEVKYYIAIAIVKTLNNSYKISDFFDTVEYKNEYDEYKNEYDECQNDNQKCDNIEV